MGRASLRRMKPGKYDRRHEVLISGAELRELWLESLGPELVPWWDARLPTEGPE